MDLIETVRTQAGLADDDQAAAAATAVLEVIGGRIAAGNVAALALELPTPLASALQRGSDGQAHVGGAAELAAAIKVPEGIDSDPADLLVAVFRGLVAVVDRETIDKLGDQLPVDLHELLQPEQEGSTAQLHANAPRPGQPGRVHETGDPSH